MTLANTEAKIPTPASTAMPVATMAATCDAYPIRRVSGLGCGGGASNIVLMLTLRAHGRETVGRRVRTRVAYGAAHPAGYGAGAAAGGIAALICLICETNVPVGVWASYFV